MSLSPRVLDRSASRLPTAPTDRAPAPVRSSDGGTLPLTAALLEAASRGLSFATPGHRGGRSCAGAT
jgi:hypothetical protein